MKGAERWNLTSQHMCSGSRRIQNAGAESLLLVCYAERETRVMAHTVRGAQSLA